MQQKTSTRLIEEAKPHIGIFFVSLFCMIASALLSVLPSWFIKISIDGLAVLQNHQDKFCILPQQILDNPLSSKLNLDCFWWKAQNLYLILPLSIIAVFFAEAIFKFFYQYEARKLGLLMVKSLREKFHAHINKLSIKQHKDIDSGSLVSVINSDLQNLQSWLAETVMNLFAESFTALFLALWLLLINWKLTLISALIIPVFVIPVVKIGKRIRLYSRQGQDLIGSNASFVGESIRNQSIIKAYNLENWRQENFAIESLSLHKLFDKWAFYMALVSPFTNLIGACGIATILFLGLQAVSQGLLTVGEFSSFFVTAILLYDPVKRLGRVTTIFQSALGVADRVYKLLDLNSEKLEGLILDQPLKGEINFRNIKFDYDGHKVFDNFDLHIPAKTSLALVGPSGGGKTSLINLLLRFYDSNIGSITIDQINIKNLDLHYLRSQIALVTQEPLLFDTSIRENIQIGLNKNTQDLESKIKQAARDSYVLEFADKLEHGLETRVGENGSKLSIGQKQRIALARAFISEAPIIILDEPTSALDNESQEFVYQSIKQLMQTRTVIVIAHRLNTIKSCDKIVYLHDGQIVETGSHDELVKLNQAYASLLE